MRKRLLLSSLYGLFLLWHNRWLSKPLTNAEVDSYLAKLQAADNEKEAVGTDQASFQAFLRADDGKPFYMVNLMQYREQAHYPDGSHPEVKTGREANALYSKAVVKELLKRGSYPVFLSRKLANLYNAGEGTDFFEEVGIVRYRSRRDLLEMASSPSFQSAEPHKWASMEKTVVVPTRKLMLLDPTIIVPALLFFAAAIGRFRGSAISD